MTDAASPGPPEGGTVEVRTTAMAFGGRAVGRVDGFVVFVEGALPGERVRARIAQVRRSHAFARVEAVIEASPERIEPPCPVFGRCGGCAFLHWSPAGQCRAKTAWVREALRRFPAAAEALPELPSDREPFRFRNRMGFSVARGDDARTVVGLHARGRPDEVLPADDCVLPLPGIGVLRTRLAEALGSLPSPPRRIEIRQSLHTGERLANLFAGTDLPGIEGLAEALDGACEHLWLTVGPEGPGHRVRRERRRLRGAGRLVERLGGRDFEIGPETFFQTNTREAEALLAHLRARTDRLAPRRIVDLYAGAGALAIGLAGPDREVLGFEASAPAVREARRNAERNGLDRVAFRRAPVEAVRPAHLGRPPDLAVVDPPRAGLSPAARRALLALEAPALLYVSCNPATLARDLDALAAAGYTVGNARAFDLFPQTAHVECVVELTR